MFFSKSNPDKLKIVERLHVTVKLIKILPWIWIGFQDKIKYDSDEQLEENTQFDWKEYSIKIYYQPKFWIDIQWFNRSDFNTEIPSMLKITFNMILSNLNRLIFS